MKYPFLFTALCCLGICYLHKWQLVIILMIILSIFYLRHFRQHFIWFLAVLMYPLATLMLQERPSMPDTDIVVITELHASYCIGKSDGQKVILYDLPEVNFDDVVRVKGTYKEIDGIHNEGEFHFPTWANRKGIYYAMNVEYSEILKAGSSLRHRLYHYVSSFDSDISNWLKMTLFQIRDKEEVAFMAASSGMHLQFLLLLMRAAGRLFLSDSIISMISICFLAGVGVSTTFTVSIMRMLCSRLIYFLFPKLSDKDRTGIIILFFICVFPSSIYEIGFVLPITYQFLHLFNIHKIKRILVTLLILIPLQFYFFQYIDLLQILLFPLFRIVYGICYGFAWLILLLPIAGALLPFITKSQHLLYAVCEAFPKLYYLPNFIWLWFWCYYAISYLETQRRMVLIKLLVLVLYTQAASYLNPFFQVTMMDVGQGDATLFVLPFHQGTMLLDVAGNRYKNIPEDIIVPMLQKRGIHSLDKVILTHDDFDHSGGLTKLLNLIQVDEVITEKQEEFILNGVHFFSPLYDRVYETSNDNSILLSLQLFDYHMLFMGDCSSVCEADILKEYPNLKVDILKLGHHGSKYSSSTTFIHQIDPQIALISAGRDNRYGHPNEEVLELLEKEEIASLNTAKQGSCTFYFSKYISFYKTADGEFGIINHR